MGLGHTATAFVLPSGGRPSRHGSHRRTTCADSRGPLTLRSPAACRQPQGYPRFQILPAAPSSRCPDFIGTHSASENTSASMVTCLSNRCAFSASSRRAASTAAGRLSWRSSMASTSCPSVRASFQSDIVRGDRPDRGVRHRGRPRSAHAHRRSELVSLPRCRARLRRRAAVCRRRLGWRPRPDAGLATPGGRCASARRPPRRRSSGR